MIYIGCYLVAKLPDRQIDVYDSCPKCGLKSNTPFCPFDGTTVPTKLVDEPICLDEIFENVDADGNEMFNEWKNIHLLPRIEGYGIGRYDSIITISPYQKRKSQVQYSWLDDYSVIENKAMGIPDYDFSIDNWDKLLKVLKKEGIWFRQEFGVLTLRESMADMPY